MKSILFTLLLVFVSTYTIAGTDPETLHTIKGTVIDENGQPLAGVEVIIEGSTTKAYTDFDGKFEIAQLKNGAYTLVFKYVSYKETKSVFKTIQTEPVEHTIKLRKRAASIQ